MIARFAKNKEVFYTAEGSGPEILFLHGAASDADTMEPLVRELRGNYRCIVLDRLGYRRSTRLEENTTIEEQASAVDAVLDQAASGPVWMFGHSSGGNVALGYTSLFPERVRGLIVMEPALYALYPEESTPLPLARMKEEIVPMFQGGDIEGGIKRFMDHLDLLHDTKVEVALAPSDKGIDNWLPLRHEFEFALSWPESRSPIRLVDHPRARDQRRANHSASPRRVRDSGPDSAESPARDTGRLRSSCTAFPTCSGCRADLELRQKSGLENRVRPLCPYF